MQKILNLGHKRQKDDFSKEMKARYPKRDGNLEISTAYNVLDEGEGVAIRGLFIIDPDGVIMHATINNLPVG